MAALIAAAALVAVTAVIVVAIAVVPCAAEMHECTLCSNVRVLAHLNSTQHTTTNITAYLQTVLLHYRLVLRCLLLYAKLSRNRETSAQISSINVEDKLYSLSNEFSCQTF
jgi:hypothetical protein